jgi:hypothetical protein
MASTSQGRNNDDDDRDVQFLAEIRMSIVEELDALERGEDVDQAVPEQADIDTSKQPTPIAVDWYEFNMTQTLNSFSACCFSEIQGSPVKCSASPAHLFCSECALRNAEVEIGKGKYPSEDDVY